MRTACIRNCLSATAATVVALAGLVHPAYGWNAGGHMMVAQIAYERLSPHARGEADRLLAVPLAPLDAWRQTQDFVRAQALRIARQRVAWAGQRLAQLLNTIFDAR